MTLSGLAKAREIIASFSKTPTATTTFASEFAYEIEINDYPQKARWIVTSKETTSRLSEMTGAAITTRGSFFPPGTFVPVGRRKLYLVNFKFLIISILKVILKFQLIKPRVKFES